ncbi:MAG: amidohydrolase [Thermomicrobiales bacterium]
MPLHDTLFLNGTVLTMNPVHPEAEAVLVRGDRIVAVGFADEMRALAAPGARIVDLAGRTLLPGFNEAHNHMLSFGLSLAQVDCRAPGCATIPELQQRVAARAAETPGGAWVLGCGYDDQSLAERRHPTRYDLDAVAPDHSVVITNASGHLCVANSRALALSGITGDTEPPEGGGIVRGADGNPTGLLLETAQELVTDLIPEPTEDELVEALGHCAERYLAAGITSSADANVHTNTQFRAFQRAAATGINPLRTTLMLREHLLPHLTETGIRTGFGSDRLRCGPIKLFIDGSLIGRTAAVTQPFLHDPDPHNLGLTMMSEEVFQGYVMDAHAAGWQIAVHAIGDRGIEMVLDAYERALTAHPRADHRHRIEHCGILRPDLIARIARLGVVVVTQPIFITEYGDSFIRHLGEERAALTYPFWSLLNAGIPMVFSSDCPVSAYEPLKSIQVSVTERTGSGAEYAPAEAINVHDALHAYTVAGAYATFEEHTKGSIAPGMLADFAVLDGDPRHTPPDALAAIPVAMTWIGGELMYERG